MSRIVLATLNAKFIHSSLALRYLRAAIQDSHDVRLREFTIHDPVEVVVGNLYDENPEVVGFSCYIWNIEETAKVLSVARKVLPHAKFVLGGPEVSYDAAHFLREIPAVDAIVVGEGELAFFELIEAYKRGRSPNGVRGVYWRSIDGQIHFGGPQPKLPNLDDLPTPYAERWMSELENRIVYFEASRGCPFSCQFCLSSIESGVRYFSLQRVKADLARLIAAGVRQIKFVDRTFNLRKDYALEIFQFLVDHPGSTTFHFEITGDILKPDIVAWLCEHAPPGLFRFEMGVQSTNDVTNALVKRRQNFERLAQTVESIRVSGRILLHLDLIAGLPEEDYASFRKTFNDVFALVPDELQLGFLKMLRGTGIRAAAAAHGYAYMDEAPYEMLYNDVLSYDDVRHLKNLEDVLEKYHNSGRFRHVLGYLTEDVFSSPFDLFQEFGDYWKVRGWSRIGHQPIDLIRRLQAFLDTSGRSDATAGALLRADYLLREKFRPRTLWWRSDLTHEEEERLLAQLRDGQLSAFPPLPSNQIRLPDFRKQSVIDRIPIGAWRRLRATGAIFFTEEESFQRQDALVNVLYVFPAATGIPTLHTLFGHPLSLPTAEGHSK